MIIEPLKFKLEWGGGGIGDGRSMSFPSISSAQYCISKSYINIIIFIFVFVDVTDDYLKPHTLHLQCSSC
jgi:hypothetical protein